MKIEDIAAEEGPEDFQKFCDQLHDLLDTCEAGTAIVAFGLWLGTAFENRDMIHQTCGHLHELALLTYDSPSDDDEETTQ
jgi:hypothetical protein